MVNGFTALFGKRLREIRKLSHYSPLELALLAGVDLGDLLSAEAGEQMLSSNQIESISVLLDVGREFLLMVERTNEQDIDACNAFESYCANRRVLSAEYPDTRSVSTQHTAPVFQASDFRRGGRGERYLKDLKDLKD